MSEVGEEQPISELNPAQKQTQLKSIYASLPETGALAEEQAGPGHFKFNIPSSGITSEERQSRFSEDVGQFIDNAVTKKELSQIKFEELQKLLKGAKITPLLKERLEYVFKGGFAFGITRQSEEKNPNSHFNLIGITPTNDMPEGIFSLDSNIRSAIDRQYLKMIKGWIEQNNEYAEISAKQNRPDRVKYFHEKNRKNEEQLQRGLNEYKELYEKEAIID